MSRILVLYLAWATALVVVAFFCAARPDVVSRLMLRDADTRVGKKLNVRSRVDSPAYQRRTRAIAIVVGCIGIVMLLIGIFGAIKPLSRN